MEKVDQKKSLKALYGPGIGPPTVVNVPSASFLMVEGEGDPNTAPAFQDAVETLFSMSYALKFAVRHQLGQDYVVMPLEGLWWTDDMTRFDIRDKGSWKWTLLIRQPPGITEAMIEATRLEVGRKKDLANLGRCRFEVFEEGLSAQVLHRGPFEAEGPTVETLHRFIKAGGHNLRGKHHEIYLSDFRRTAPEKLKTIIRQPLA
jgi:hypothetical protein